MTDATHAGLMAQRIELVEKLTALNARQLLHSQARAGIEVELLSCAEEIEANGETASALSRRAELEDRLARIVASSDDCDRERDELAGQLNRLERQMAEA